MECTVTRLLTDEQGITGAFGYWRESGRFVAWQAPSVVLATGGIGKSYKVTSNSWEYTGDGLPRAAGRDAGEHGVRPVPPDRDGVAAVGARDPRDGERPRRRRHPEELRGNRFMFDYIPDFFRKETAETEAEADRWYDDKKNNRRPPELLPATRSPARSTAR